MPCGWPSLTQIRDALRLADGARQVAVVYYAHSAPDHEFSMELFRHAHRQGLVYAGRDAAVPLRRQIHAVAAVHAGQRDMIFAAEFRKMRQYIRDLAGIDVDPA